MSEYVSSIGSTNSLAKMLAQPKGPMDFRSSLLGSTDYQPSTLTPAQAVTYGNNNSLLEGMGGKTYALDGLKVDPNTKRITGGTEIAPPGSSGEDSYFGNLLKDEFAISNMATIGGLALNLLGYGDRKKAMEQQLALGKVNLANAQDNRKFLSDKRANLNKPRNV
jgi:hypothetical protein